MASRRVLVVGAGYVGLYTALRLERRLAAGEADLTLVNPENFMVYRPLLPEVAAGTLEPRHAVVPLRAALRRTRVVTGRLVGLDASRRVASVVSRAEDELALGYDQLVLGLGAMTKLLPVPGLAEHAVGFTSVAEAIHLRDRVLGQLETAAATADPIVRRRALTFVVVGGGYTGVEALAELADMAAQVAGGYEGISPEDLRWVLVEATDRLLPSLPERLADTALRELTRRGVEVRLETTVDSVDGDTLKLSDGSTLPTGTLVWVAGVAPHGLVRELGLPCDDAGRLEVDGCLRVRGTPGVWGAGDCAAVPDLVAGGTCPPTAQHAVREARQLADNIVAELRRGRLRPFRYASRGEFVTLGRHQGVAEVFGRPLAGMPAWLARRAYYVGQIPTGNRKARVLLDWAAGLPFGHDVVDLGSQEHPRAAFEEAVRAGQGS